MLSRTIGDTTIEYETASTSQKTSWFDSPDHSTSISGRSEEHTSELQSLMRISYAVFCLKKKKKKYNKRTHTNKDYILTPILHNTMIHTRIKEKRKSTQHTL